MALFELTKYKLQCDGCGCSFKDKNENDSWSTVKQLFSETQKHKWIKHGDKHYCPKCYKMDSGYTWIKQAGR